MEEMFCTLCPSEEEELSNALMKGLLFVQEMYNPDWSLIDKFCEEYPEKYNFLFKRGRPDDKVIFQGSSSEGLVVYDIEELDSRKDYWHRLKYFRHFDFDVMSIRNDIVVLDQYSQYLPALMYYFNWHANGQPRRK